VADPGLARLGACPLGRHRHLIRESKSQTKSRSVQPFLHISRQRVAILYDGPPLSPLKLPLYLGDLNPHIMMIPLAHPRVIESRYFGHKNKIYDTAGFL